ncbi:MAG: FAD/NAD(P)-binding oxidoreductase [Thermoanaerobacterales bacterium]|nr:FAD/NAD(P)-binding oxidoreductase [Thermoanaerobacterales bacterium]
MARIVVLGGGTGGAAVARSLAAKLPAGHRVTLVEKEAEVYFQPSFLWVMVGRRRLDQIGRAVNNLRAAGVEVIIDRALGIDLERRRLRLAGDTLPYDILVLAAGAEAGEPDPAGLGRAGFNLYTPDGASAVRGAIETLEGGEVVVLAAGEPIKCPPAPYEAALLLHSYFARKGRGENIRLSVYTPGTAPLAVAGKGPSDAIAGALAARGISFYTGQRLERVDPGRRLIRFSGGGEARFDLLIYVSRHRCPEAVRQSGLVDDSGWVPVDPFTLRTEAQGVYAIGDVNRVRLPSGDELFKAGEIAHFQGLVVADNIAAGLQGREPRRLFGGKLGCVFETGDSALAIAGNIYRRRPNLLVLPSSRGWVAVKWLAEREWLREHS